MNFIILNFEFFYMFHMKLVAFYIIIYLYAFIVLAHVSAGNLVSYSIPVGDAWSEALSLDDYTYDGLKESGLTWIGGLGLLTDGHYGSDNFKMDLGTHKGILTTFILLGCLLPINLKGKPFIPRTICYRAKLGGLEKRATVFI